MKIEKSKQFEPIRIVLETQQEVDFMHELTRHISGVGEMRNFFDRIRIGLVDHSTLDYTVSERLLEGDLRVTR